LYVYKQEFLFLHNQCAAFSQQNKIRVLEMGIASVRFLQILAAYFGPEQAEIVGFGIEPIFFRRFTAAHSTLPLLD
jgi:hypothetical protein